MGPRPTQAIGVVAIRGGESSPPRPSSNEPSGNNSRTVYCTGSTLGTRSWSTTKSTRSTKSSIVVQGVNGSHDGRTSMPWRRRSTIAADASATVWPLSRVAERGVVDRLEGGHHERAAGIGQVGEGFAVPEDVFHLGGAIEGQVRMSFVHGGHDPTGVERGVEEVGIGERHVPGAGRHQLVDVGHHCGHVNRAGPGRRR